MINKWISWYSIRMKFDMGENSDNVGITECKKLTKEVIMKMYKEH